MARKDFTIRAQRSAAVWMRAARAATAGSRGLLLQQHRVGDHDGQRVVQLVSDAGQQRAERRHLLALMQGLALSRQLRLGLMPLGDVAPHRLIACEITFGIEQGAIEELEPARLDRGPNFSFSPRAIGFRA